MDYNSESDAPGWDAITKEAERIYPDQTDPKHYGTLVSWELGGSDPLDGISIYDGGNYWHFVSYGLSELYEKKSRNLEWSGYGMEFTFKLKKDNYADEEAEIRCICSWLQQLARSTFKSGTIFKAFEYIYTGSTAGIDDRELSNITGFITIPDTNFQTINTINGKVNFIELVGVTDEELRAIRSKQMTVQELYTRLGSDITDYNRQSII